MKNTAYTQIIFTNRTDIPVRKTIPKTLQISQVQGDKEIGDDWNWSLTTSNLPCSYPQCRCNTCLTVRPMNEREVYNNDEFGLKLLTCPQSREEMESIGLKTTGLKADLFLRMKLLLESERDDFLDDDAGGREDTDTSCGGGGSCL